MGNCTVQFLLKQIIICLDVLRVIRILTTPGLNVPRWQSHENDGGGRGGLEDWRTILEDSAKHLLGGRYKTPAGGQLQNTCRGAVKKHVGWAGIAARNLWHVCSL